MVLRTDIFFVWSRLDRTLPLPDRILDSTGTIKKNNKYMLILYATLQNKLVFRVKEKLEEIHICSPIAKNIYATENTANS